MNAIKLSALVAFGFSVLTLSAQKYYDVSNEESSARWSLEKAQEWGKANPWYCGVNFVPSYAINDVEIWSKETFSAESIRRELALAKSLGMNCVRIFLQYIVYEDDPQWFLSAFEQFVCISAESGLKVMPVLFDDCHFGTESDPKIGKQSDPLPGWCMWSWVPSPGRTMVVDSRTHGKLEQYVKDVIARYKDDSRIFLWDLFNEPANDTGKFSEFSYILVKKSFGWAREVDPVQPISVGLWNNDETLNRILAAESDIITYHGYLNAEITRWMIDEMKKYGRPVICTEWMSRLCGNSIPECLNIYKENGIGCMIWGLVNGRDQDHLPFGYQRELPYTGIWKHDLYKSDCTPYDSTDLEIIRQATGIR